MSLPPTFVQGFHDEEAVRKMRYNPLGNTGLQVSHLGFGGAALANNLYEDFQEEDGIKVVHSALKRGVNFIDTAAFYGKERASERILGKALKGIPREAYYIATKADRYYNPTSPTYFDFSYDATIKSVDKSLEMLNLSYVDIIHAHDIEFAPSLEVVLDETLPALADVVKAGKARFIGVTGYPISVLREAVERSKVHVDVVLCYARATLNDMTLLDYLPFFQSRGMGIISAAGISMGLLSNRGPFPWHPAPQHTKDMCAKAAEICKSRGVELGKLAAFHTMSVSGPATHLLGMNSWSMLEHNLAVCTSGLSHQEEQLLQHIKTTCFNNLSINHHWEGVELAKYRAQNK